MHTTRRLNFAGKLHLHFYNNWDCVIWTDFLNIWDWTMGNLIWWASRIQAALTARGPLLENGKFSQIGWAHLTCRRGPEDLNQSSCAEHQPWRCFFICNGRLSLDILRPDSQSPPGWVPVCLQESERWCWLRQESCRVVQLQEGFSRPEPPQINIKVVRGAFFAWRAPILS